MYKLISVGFLTLLLLGCGGSSDKEKPVTVPPVNTAPTMSGVLTLEAKAANETTVVLDVTDSENDIINFTIENSPSWVAFTQENNQVTIKFNPSFFDINNYQLTFNLSDGKADNQYTYSVNVIDNKEKWLQESITKNELLGAWYNEQENISFAFLEDESGFYTNKEKLTGIRWSIPDTVDLSVFRLYCFENCERTDFIELDIVAKKDDMIRVNMTNDSGNRAFNLIKNNNQVTQNQYSISLPQQDYNLLSEININNESSELSLEFFNIKIGNSTFTTSKLLEGNINTTNGVSEFVITSSPLVYSNAIAGFDDIYSNFTYLNFDVVVDKVTVQPLTDNKQVFIVSYHVELKTDLAGVPISNYYDLEEALKPKHSANLVQTVNKLNTPDIASGSTYTGRLISNLNNNDLILDGTKYSAGASVFKFIDQTEGSSDLKIAGKNSRKVQEFTWQKNESNISVTLNNIETVHEFFELPDGQIGISYTSENDGKSRSIYSFIKLDNLTPTVEDYIGVWKHRSDSGIGLGDSFMHIEQSGLSEYYGDNPENSYYGSLWHLEDDKSISMINKFYCPNIDNYTDCYTYAINNLDSNFGLLIRNIKLLAKDDNESTFQYSYWRKNLRETESEFTDFAIQSLRTFTKVNN